MKILSTLFVFLMATQAQAHAGHDHAHWLSEPIHFLSVFAVIAVIGTAAYVVNRSRQTKKNEEV